MENKEIYSMGTDGGNFSSSSIQPNIGYTDGVPFVSANKPVPPVKPDEKILGYTYGYMANRGEYRSDKAKQSQDLLYQLNNNWVCLAIANYQTTYNSTVIFADHLRTPTDRDIAFFVNNAHNQGVKVCLKPMVNCDDFVWRAFISFPEFDMAEKNIYWSKWFENYKNFILHYAALAQELGVEMLCIGCEMLGTEHRYYDWLYVIKEVRRVYSGKIVYNTNHDHEGEIGWIDELDYLGTSAYYPVGGENCTYEEMMEGWGKVKDRLDRIAKEKGKQYLFMEVGCRSIDNNSKTPWDFNLDYKWNEEEQYNYYKSCFDTFLDSPNFAGVFWWDWPTFQYDTREAAEQDKGFNIHLKKTEELVKQVYEQYQKK